MEVWARYRMGRADSGNGWPKKVILGKMQDGMPGTGCPTCGGKGSVSGALYGVARAKVSCLTCNGDGKVKLDGGNKVNPAFIMPTGSRKFMDDDPRSQKVDWLVCTVLTEYQRVVVMATYTQNGTQDQKSSKMGISQGFFSKLLGEAHDLIMSRLDTDS